MPDSRKKGSMTKQQRTLKRFTKLWLSAVEWEEPEALEEDGRIVAWTIKRRKPS